MLRHSELIGSVLTRSIFELWILHILLYFLHPLAEVELWMTTTKMSLKDVQHEALFFVHLSADGPAGLFFSLFSLLLGHGPRLDLCRAKHGEDHSAEGVDPGWQPEHLSPAVQGVLATTEEEMHNVKEPAVKTVDKAPGEKLWAIWEADARLPLLSLLQ